LFEKNEIESVFRRNGITLSLLRKWEGISIVTKKKERHKEENRV
jgi:hypothetical protein